MSLLKTFSIAIILSVFSVNAYAKSLNEKYPSLYSTEWEQKMKLSPQQIEMIKQIREKNQEKMNVFLMEIDTIHHEISALVEENDEQIRDILSEKQKVKLDMYHYQLKKQNNEHRNEEKPSRKKMRVY